MSGAVALKSSVRNAPAATLSQNAELRCACDDRRFLNERCAQPEVREAGCESREDEDHADQSELGRRQQAGQRDGESELEGLYEHLCGAAPSETGERARPEGARLTACRDVAICGGQHPIHYGCERSDVASELGLHVAGHFDDLDVRGDRAPPVALGRDIG